jgi:hypothetical protein
MIKIVAFKAPLSSYLFLVFLVKILNTHLVHRYLSFYFDCGQNQGKSQQEFFGSIKPLALDYD